MEKESVSISSRHPEAIHSVELQKRRWLSKTAFEVELSRPPSFEFKAGQTIMLIHDSAKRYYSLISTPDDPELALCVQHVQQGELSSVLAAAETGFSLKMSGPHGYFTFKPSVRMPVFLATGTGIAPFVCFARSGITEFTLFQQAASADELYYQSYFQKIAPKYFACFPESSASESLPPHAFCGRPSECIRKNLRRERYDFYLCGEREMIREVTLTVDETYPGSRVYTEVFY